VVFLSFPYASREGTPVRSLDQMYRSILARERCQGFGRIRTARVQ
jgi:hypothetical protein